MRRMAQLDPSEVEIGSVHCTGCGRLVGVFSAAVLKTKLTLPLFCNDMCWHKDQVDNLENAARDRFIRLLVGRGLMSAHKTAAAFGLHRSRVQQIVAFGDGGDYLQIGRRPSLTDEQRANRVRAAKLGMEKRWGPK